MQRDDGVRMRARLGLGLRVVCVGGGVRLLWGGVEFEKVEDVSASAGRRGRCSHETLLRTPADEECQGEGIGGV